MRHARTDDSPPCPLCRAPSANLFYRLQAVTVWRCPGCHLSFLFPPPSVEEIELEFETLYKAGCGVTPELTGYYDYCFDHSPGNPAVSRCEYWLDLLESHTSRGALLDVGCGTGLFLHTARRRGWKAFGFDSSEESLSHAQRVGRLPVFRAHAESLPTGAGWMDAVTLWDVVEHLRDPVGFFTNLRSLLRPEGVVIAATPNRRNLLGLMAHVIHRSTFGAVEAPLTRFYVKQHLYYFTPEVFRLLLERTGFELEAVYPESTDLQRLSLKPSLAVGLRIAFAVARVCGLENRFVAVARPKP